METSSTMWIAFSVLVVIMLAVDLGANRKGKPLSFRGALTWSAVWIAMALFFNAGIWLVMGKTPAIEFFTGYVIEKSLSIDNLFVFTMIFSAFNIKGGQQLRVLKWGIIGALVMRAIFIAAGASLLSAFDWMFYVFGAILILTAVKMIVEGDEEKDPSKSMALRAVKKVFPVVHDNYGDKFFVKCGKGLAITPLFMALFMVEFSDVVFAVDSVPAIFAVTRDPFLVYSSNVFAILGLRALYFLLANIMDLFVHLKIGISLILAFVGVKMLVLNLGIHIPSGISLGVIFGTLATVMLTSVFVARKAQKLAIEK